MASQISVKPRPDLERSIAEVIHRFGDQAPAVIARMISAMDVQAGAQAAAS